MRRRTAAALAAALLAVATVAPQPQPSPAPAPGQLCPDDVSLESVCTLFGLNLELSNSFALVLNGSLVLSNSSISVAPCVDTTCSAGLLALSTGGNITLQNSNMAAPSTILFAGDSLYVDGTSFISANAMGPTVTDLSLSADGYAGKGGGHGGAGADIASCAGAKTSGGAAFGFSNWTMPFAFGGASSGIGWACDSHTVGGGRVWVTALNAIGVDGKITADGEASTSAFGCEFVAGGGAGGSVFFGAGGAITLGASGYVSAVGGSAFSTGSGGGGIIGFSSASLFGATQTNVNVSGGYTQSPYLVTCPLGGTGIWYHGATLGRTRLAVDSLGLAVELQRRLLHAAGGSASAAAPASVLASVWEGGNRVVAPGSGAWLLSAEELSQRLRALRLPASFVQRYLTPQAGHGYSAPGSSESGAADRELADAAETLARCLHEAAPIRLLQLRRAAREWEQQQGSPAPGAGLRPALELIQDHAVSWCLLAHPHVFPDPQGRAHAPAAAALPPLMRRALLEAQLAERTQAALQLAGGPAARVAASLDAPRRRTAAAVAALTSSSASASVSSAALSDPSVSTSVICVSQAVHSPLSPLTLTAVTAWPTRSNVAMTECAWALDLRSFGPALPSGLPAVSWRMAGSSVQVESSDFTLNVSSNVLLTSFSRFSAADTSTRLSVSAGGNLTVQTSVISAGTLCLATPQQINVQVQAYIRFGYGASFSAGSLLIMGTVSQIDLPPGPTTLLMYSNSTQVGTDASVVANTIVALVAGDLLLQGSVQAVQTAFSSTAATCPGAGQPAAPAVDVNIKCSTDPSTDPGVGTSGFSVWLAAGSLEVNSGGQVLGATIRVCARQLQVAVSGAISSQGLGCNSQTGQGAGDSGVGIASSGAGHGGFGGSGVSAGGAATPGGVAYDNVSLPLFLGSGGGDSNLGGAGGGFIWVEAVSFDLDGDLVGSGAPGNPAVLPSGLGGGGGSGGSLVLVTANLTGAGIVDFGGGAGGAPGGGGGAGGVLRTLWLDAAASPEHAALLAGRVAWHECVQRTWAERAQAGDLAVSTCVFSGTAGPRLPSASTLTAPAAAGSPWAACGRQLELAAAAAAAPAPIAVLQPLAVVSSAPRLGVAPGNDFSGLMGNEGGSGAAPGEAGSHGVSISIPSCRAGEGGALCLACQPGWFKAEAGSNAPCQQCPPGTASNSSGSMACSSCNATSIAPLQGTAICSVCAANFLPNPQRTACDFCALGHGGPGCTPCAPGSSNNDSTTNPCKPCRAGYAQPLIGQTECSACGPMTYAPAQGASQCEACPVGAVSGNASALCAFCGPATYADAGSASCQACQPNTFSGGNLSVCTPCLLGEYSSPDASHCLSCPAKPEHSSWAPRNGSTSAMFHAVDAGLGESAGSSRIAGVHRGSPVPDLQLDLQLGADDPCAFRCDTGFVAYPQCVTPLLVSYTTLGSWPGLVAFAGALLLATLLAQAAYVSLRPQRRVGVAHAWVPDSEEEAGSKGGVWWWLPRCGGGCCGSGDGSAAQSSVEADAYWGVLSYEEALRPTRPHPASFAGLAAGLRACLTCSCCRSGRADSSDAGAYGALPGGEEGAASAAAGAAGMPHSSSSESLTSATKPQRAARGYTGGGRQQGAAAAAARASLAVVGSPAGPGFMLRTLSTTLTPLHPLRSGGGGGSVISAGAAAPGPLPGYARYGHSRGRTLPAGAGHHHRYSASASSSSSSMAAAALSPLGPAVTGRGRISSGTSSFHPTPHHGRASTFGMGGGLDELTPGGAAAAGSRSRSGTSSGPGQGHEAFLVTPTGGHGLGAAHAGGPATPAAGAAGSGHDAGAASSSSAAASSSASTSLPVADLSRHVHRVYLQGSNTPFSPLQLDPRVSPALAPLVYAAEWAEHCREVNGLARWREWEVRAANCLRLACLPLALLWEGQARRRHVTRLRALYRERDASYLRNTRARALGNCVAFGHSQDCTLAWVDLLVSDPAESPPGLPVGAPQLPAVLPFAGDGSFACPLHLDLSDSLSVALLCLLGPDFAAMAIGLGNQLRALSGPSLDCGLVGRRDGDRAERGGGRRKGRSGSHSRRRKGQHPGAAGRAVGATDTASGSAAEGGTARWALLREDSRYEEGAEGGEGQGKQGERCAPMRVVDAVTGRAGSVSALNPGQLQMSPEHLRGAAAGLGSPQQQLAPAAASLLSPTATAQSRSAPAASRHGGQQGADAAAGAGDAGFLSCSHGVCGCAVTAANVARPVQAQRAWRRVYEFCCVVNATLAARSEAARQALDALQAMQQEVAARQEQRAAAAAERAAAASAPGAERHAPSHSRAGSAVERSRPSDASLSFAGDPLAEAEEAAAAAAEREAEEAALGDAEEAVREALRWVPFGFPDCEVTLHLGVIPPASGAAEAAGGEWGGLSGEGAEDAAGGDAEGSPYGEAASPSAKQAALRQWQLSGQRPCLVLVPRHAPPPDDLGRFPFPLPYGTVCVRPSARSPFDFLTSALSRARVAVQGGSGGVAGSPAAKAPGGPASIALVGVGSAAGAGPGAYGMGRDDPGAPGLAGEHASGTAGAGSGAYAYADELALSVGADAYGLAPSAAGGGGGSVYGHPLAQYGQSAYGHAGAGTLPFAGGSSASLSFSGAAGGRGLGAVGGVLGRPLSLASPSYQAQQQQQQGQQRTSSVAGSLHGGSSGVRGSGKWAAVGGGSPTAAVRPRRRGGCCSATCALACGALSRLNYHLPTLRNSPAAGSPSLNAALLLVVLCCNTIATAMLLVGYWRLARHMLWPLLAVPPGALPLAPVVGHLAYAFGRPRLHRTHAALELLALVSCVLCLCFGAAMLAAGTLDWELGLVAPLVLMLAKVAVLRLGNARTALIDLQHDFNSHDTAAVAFVREGGVSAGLRGLLLLQQGAGEGYAEGADGPSPATPAGAGYRGHASAGSGTGGEDAHSSALAEGLEGPLPGSEDRGAVLSPQQQLRALHGGRLPVGDASFAMQHAVLRSPRPEHTHGLSSAASGRPAELAAAAGVGAGGAVPTELADVFGESTYGQW